MDQCWLDTVRCGIVALVAVETMRFGLELWAVVRAAWKAKDLL